MNNNKRKTERKKQQLKVLIRLSTKRPINPLAHNIVTNWLIEQCKGNTQTMVRNMRIWSDAFW